MARYFERITINKLKSIILKKAEEKKLFEDYDEDLGEPDRLVGSKLSSLQEGIMELIPRSDLKVQFDFENVDSYKTYEYQRGNKNDPGGYTDKLTDDIENQILGFNTLDNGLSYWGIQAGGDWEQLVFFIIYWDGKKLRGYIPTDGNLFNSSTMMAYGNNDDKKYCRQTDQENFRNRFSVKYDVYGIRKYINPSLIIDDIKSRIKEKK